MTHGERSEARENEAGHGEKPHGSEEHRDGGGSDQDVPSATQGLLASCYLARARASCTANCDVNIAEDNCSAL